MAKKPKVDRKVLAMYRKGNRFARYYLPKGWQLIGFNPGYLFSNNAENRCFNVPTDIVDHLLYMLDDG